MYQSNNNIETKEEDWIYLEQVIGSNLRCSQLHLCSMLADSGVKYTSLCGNR